jgi:hypothetical protein
MHVPVLIRLVMHMVIGGLCWVPAAMSSNADNTELETTVRALVRANAEKDLPTMSKLMAHDADIISYSIGGRKYVGWSNLERDIKEEFEKVAALNLPISELKVWSKGDIGWYTMELDYVRVLGQGPGQVCLNVETASGSSYLGMSPSAMSAVRCLSMFSQIPLHHALWLHRSANQPSMT